MDEGELIVTTLFWIIVGVAIWAVAEWNRKRKERS